MSDDNVTMTRKEFVLAQREAAARGYVKGWRTSGHCERVAQLVELIESAAWDEKSGAESDFTRAKMSGDESRRTYELRAAEHDRNANLLYDFAKELPTLYQRVSRLEADKQAMTDGDVWLNVEVWPHRWWHVGTGGANGPFDTADEALAAYHSTKEPSNG